MNKTKIPWADYTINPVKGLCPMDCKDKQGEPYCYARRMYKRFKWNPEIRYDALWWEQLGKLKASSKIFIGSTIELFGDWVKWEWLKYVFQKCEDYPQHTFIFLTKQPQNLIKFSPFPDNCWVGVSATDYTMANHARYYLGRIKATVKYLSLEPLLEPLVDRTGCSFGIRGSSISWVIIGSRTQPTKHPPREWVDEIITAADNAKIPVFVKEPMASHYGIFRQEFPA